MHFQTILVVGMPLASLMTALFFSKAKTDINSILISLFGLMFVTELVAPILQTISENGNYVVYNIYTVLFFLHVFMIFFKLTTSNKIEEQIKYFAGFFVLFFIFDTIFYQNIYHKLQYPTYVLGALMALYFVVRHLLTILNSDDIYDYYLSKSFWFSCGLLLFIVPFIPIMISYEFLLFSPLILETLNPILIVAMHSCFIISNIWTTRI